MTHATDILRDVEDRPLIRERSLLERLGLLEDRRRAIAFQNAKPNACVHLARALDALRPVCRNAGVDAYRRDIQALAECDLSDIELWFRDSGFDDETTQAWFQHAVASCGLYRTEDGHFTANVFFCELFDVWYSQRTQSHEVTVRWRNGVRDIETWSDDAVEESAFYCEGSQRYYANSSFDSGRTSDGNTVCETWAELTGYWSDGDGYWRNDDQDDEDDCGIPSYHDADRPWTMDTARKSPVAYYGLEVELCFDDTQARLDFYEDVGFPTADLTAERDGSLDDEEGLEVISRPFTLLELRQHRNPLQQAMDVAVTFEAAMPSPAGYGVHVTTNAQRLSSDHRKRLVDATYDMRALTEFVAGRKGNHEYYSYNKTGRRAEKYTAVNERSDGSFEFRVFQGTPDWQVLLSYVEYVDALTEWTRNPANPTQGPVGQALLRAWAQATGRYPALSRRFTTTLTQETLACALPLLSRAA